MGLMAILLASLVWVKPKYVSLNRNQVNLPVIKSASPTPRSPILQPIRILFGGDIMLDRHIRLAAEKNGGYDFILASMKNWLDSYDLVVANLEGPITTKPSISVHSRPGEPRNYSFTFDPKVVNFLADNNIGVVNLGNNHILNFGQKGLNQTISFLTQAEIGFFGQPSQADNYIIKDFYGFKIGFVNYNQFDKASREKIWARLKKAKQTSDWLVVYAHWGIEYQPIANNQISRLAHQLIDNGADLIIGSHPHVVQNWQEYKGKRIYYSLGNFVFDQYFSAEVKKGLLIEARINPKDKMVKYRAYWLKLLPSGESRLRPEE